ncbi:MAG: HD domain-containing protein [Xanthomonadaceae bacterium]|nr:HD domain-containing protein [Xanthomonadaceae bacterium]
MGSMFEIDPILSKLFETAKEIIDHDDPGHDLAHALRVVSNALKLKTEETPPHLAVAAALLHDSVNVPKNSPERKNSAFICAQKAREILGGLQWKKEDVEAVAIAIEDHSFSRGVTPRTELGKILQDADRLEAIGAIGIMRVFSTGAKMNSKYFHPTDPWAKSRSLDDIKFSIDHFFTKLLKLESSFQTENGKKLAHSRTQYMRGFLDQVRSEIDSSL